MLFHQRLQLEEALDALGSRHAPPFQVGLVGGLHGKIDLFSRGQGYAGQQLGRGRVGLRPVIPPRAAPAIVHSQNLLIVVI